MTLQIINIIALIVIPIFSVLLGQYLQRQAKKREDKLSIFKSLMTSRIYGWTVDSVHALNLIDVVFAKDKKVIAQWKIAQDKLFVENPTETELRKIKQEKDKLLKFMAESLGYKIDLETFQNPYIPIGLTEVLNNQKTLQSTQFELMQKMNHLVSSSQNTNQSKGV